MNALKPAILGGILIAAVAVPWLAYHRATLELRRYEDSLNEQTSLLSELSGRNQTLSNAVARANGSQALSGAQLTELLKLRNEAGQLRQLPGEMAKLHREMGRLRRQLEGAAAEEESGPQKDTALLADEMPLRQARVVRLKRWLEDMPGEKIPELQFVSEDRWINRVDGPLVTDEDYRVAIGLLRADGEQKFVPMAYAALKSYAAANNGQFPADAGQLQPYFNPPVDAEILQRFEVVPAASLVPFLAGTGGEWLLTEKAPVNKTFDMRNAIGLTSFRGTGGGGEQWDPVQ